MDPFPDAFYRKKLVAFLDLPTLLPLSGGEKKGFAEMEPGSGPLPGPGGETLFLRVEPGGKKKFYNYELHRD